MPQPFDPATDFLTIAADIGFPGNVTVRRINADTGNTTTTNANIAAVGRTLDGTPAGVGENGEIFPRSKRWWIAAGQLTFTPTARDQIVSGTAAYEIESLRLVAFDALYEATTHYLGTA